MARSEKPVPCPRCGGEPVVHYHTETGWWSVWCDACPGHVSAHSRREAVRRWLDRWNEVRRERQ